MEPNPKNLDCYFYYYSECLRANQCKFRHEPSARGCETMCMKWKEGNCTEPHCSLRHMELKKKRKEIPCYWEKQPGGCKKSHCAFQHQLKSGDAEGQSASGASKSNQEEAPTENAQDWARRVHNDAVASYEPDSANIEAARRLSQSGTEGYGSPPVDPLVVNFEEESDSESAPSWTPTKVPREKDTLHVKTLEEIRLEKIQAESAAYWEGIAGGPMAWEAANPAANPTASPSTTSSTIRKSFNSQLSTSSSNFKKCSMSPRTVAKELDFRILSLDEIRRNRSRKAEASGLNKVTDNDKPDKVPIKKLPVNGHNSATSIDMKARLGITDLRSKLRTSLDSVNDTVVSSSIDTVNSKRQRADSSSQGIPTKKQRIKLQRLSGGLGSDTVGESEMDIPLSPSDNSPQAGSDADLSFEVNILNDIDKLLMD